MKLDDNVINDIKELWPNKWNDIIKYFEKKKDLYNSYPDNVKEKVKNPKIDILEKIEGRRKLIEYEKDVLNKIIPKENLKDGVTYLSLEGTNSLCRYVDEARWDKQNDCFWYVRTKFGHTFEDSMEHFSDVIDKNLAGFTPYKEK
jgi:uncharacterized protein YcgL (UPF0745 family)